MSPPPLPRSCRQVESAAALRGLRARVAACQAGNMTHPEAWRRRNELPPKPDTAADKHWLVHKTLVRLPALQVALLTALHPVRRGSGGDKRRGERGGEIGRDSA